MNTTLSETRVQAKAERPSAFLPWGLRLPLLASGVAHVLMALRGRVVWGDEPFYLWLGQNWLHGRGYQFVGVPDVHHPPGYPLLTAALSLLTGDAATASTLLYVVFGMLLVVPVYGIAHEIYGPRTAALAAWIVALLPALNVAVPVWGSLTEPPYLFLVAGAIYLTLRVLREGKPLHALLAGLALGLAYLVRPEAVWFVLVLGLLLLVIPFVQGRRSWRWLLSLVLYALGFFACFGPYAYYTYVNTGAWLVSQKAGFTFGHAQYLAVNDSIGADRYIWGLDSTGEQVFFFSDESHQLSIVQSLQDDPRAFLSHLYRNVRTLGNKAFSLVLLPNFLGLLAVLGLFGAPWNRWRLRGELVLLAALIPPLTFLLFFVLERYYLPLLIPLSIWAGHGLRTLADWAAATWEQLRGRAPSATAGTLLRGGLALLVALALVWLTPRTLAAALNNRSVRAEHQAIGLWLRDNTPPGARLMARYPAIAYYAERQWVPSPHADYDATLRYARAQQADYWVVDAWETEWRPQIAFLLTEPLPPGLEMVGRMDDGPAPLLVFRVVPAAE